MRSIFWKTLLVVATLGSIALFLALTQEQRITCMAYKHWGDRFLPTDPLPNLIPFEAKSISSGMTADVLLTPEAARALRHAINLANEEGYELRIGLSWRSAMAEADAYCSSSESPGHAVAPRDSVHRLGEAVDVFLFDQEGNQLTFFSPGDSTHIQSLGNISTLLSIMKRSCFKSGMEHKIAHHEHLKDCSTESLNPIPSCNQNGDCSAQ